MTPWKRTQSTSYLVAGSQHVNIDCDILKWISSKNGLKFKDVFFFCFLKRYKFDYNFTQIQLPHTIGFPHMLFGVYETIDMCMGL